MLTPHEAAVEHLKTLNRSDHPEIEELLSVVRQYPVEIQRACEDAVKRGEDAAVLYPIKAIADRHAVAVQELLDALTAEMPHRVDLMRSAEPSLADRQLGEQSPFLPGTADDILWRQQHGRSLGDLRSVPTDDRGFAPAVFHQREGEAFSGFGSAPFTQSGLTPNPESGRSGLDTSQSAAPFVDPGHPSLAAQEIAAMRAKLEDGVDASEIRPFLPGSVLREQLAGEDPVRSALFPHETTADGEVIRSEPFEISAERLHPDHVNSAETTAALAAGTKLGGVPFREGQHTEADLDRERVAAQVETAEAERAAQNANMGGHPAEPLPTSEL